MKLPMLRNPSDPDQVNAIIVPDAPGMWTFRVDVWADPIETWRRAITAKIDAGLPETELANDLEHGARLFDKAAHANAKDRRTLLRDVAASLRSDGDIHTKVAPALSPAVRQILVENPLRELTTTGPTYSILVERREALVGSWYELFPRSTGGWDADGVPVHGTFKTTAAALDRVAAMGFDTVYFPPIHPIGRIHRKGKNNTLTALPDDVGSPWAVGADEGGHDAVHPELGTIEDFDALIARARELNLEVALDLALQCAPDHPWAREHPEWFTQLPDGTIAYAENPPKKYQDIYPLNFDNDPQGLADEILRIVNFWISHGVTTFRVDNPHTKPVRFWAELIETVHASHPEVIFLAEAFTRPAVLYGLAKAGFTQSYSYFTWKTTKKELQEFGEEIARRADICRPNLFVNTPDILHASLQYGGRAMFAIRAVLASTLSPLWGVYSGYELFENQAVKPGSEEYLDSEKYQLRPRDFEGAAERGESLELLITCLNEIRRDNPALQQLREISFHDTDSDAVIAYSKVDTVTGNAVLVIVNLDPFNARETTVHLEMSRLGLDPGRQFAVTDLLTHEEYVFSEHAFVRLEPWRNVAHILRLPVVPEDRREQIAWRRVLGYEA